MYGSNHLKTSSHDHQFTQLSIRTIFDSSLDACRVTISRISENEKLKLCVGPTFCGNASDLTRLHEKQLEDLKKEHQLELEQLELQHREEIYKLTVSTLLVVLVASFLSFFFFGRAGGGGWCHTAVVRAIIKMDCCRSNCGTGSLLEGWVSRLLPRLCKAQREKWMWKNRHVIKGGGGGQ